MAPCGFPELLALELARIGFTALAPGVGTAGVMSLFKRASRSLDDTGGGGNEAMAGMLAVVDGTPNEFDFLEPKEVSPE
jgi:hypothetical protein